MKEKDVLLSEEKHDFESLVSITEILRGERGCPWDRVQTHESVRRCLIEETCEVLEALDTNDSVLLREELGDLLFQIVFHARLEEEAGEFSAGDVVDSIAAKMIRRHPHVFADEAPENINWDEIKKKEKGNTAKQPLYTAPPLLSSVLKAQKAYGKLKGTADFGYEDVNGALAEAGKAIAAASDTKQAKQELSAQLAKAAFALCAAAQSADIDLERELSAEVKRLTEKCVYN